MKAVRRAKARVDCCLLLGETDNLSLARVLKQRSIKGQKRKPVSSNCTNWPAAFGGRSCVGASALPGLQLPGALLRNGVFEVHAEFNPSQSAPTFGFRCVR
jgi:hypothetical protein